VSLKGKSMKDRGTSQRNLFDEPVAPVEIPPLNRAKVLGLLGILLTEVQVARLDGGQLSSREAGDDPDHG
jgi:predicted ATP-grasp superfamily ATP-dependent carboligase